MNAQLQHCNYNTAGILKCSLVLLTGVVSVAGCSQAAERQIAIRDYTGRGFAPDVVHYTVSPKTATKLRVVGSDGKVLPSQVAVSADKKSATLSFVATVPPNGVANYTVRDDGRGAVPTSTAKITSEGNGQVLSNALFAIRVPVIIEKKFNPAVAASTLPAPILGFRGSDGAWRGGGKVLSARKVTAFRVRNIAKGPAFSEVRYEIDFVGGGYYRADVRVADQVPLAKVREEFDAKELSGKDYWELNLTNGWSPDSLETATAWGNGEPDRGKVVPLSTLGATPDPIQPKWMIVAGNAWVTPRNHIGLFSEADKKARPDNYALAGFTPLHHGDWRRSMGIEIHSTDSKEVRLRLPISVRRPAFNKEIASDTSPMSVNEHEPGLPETYGRRVWGLVIAPPKLPAELDVLNAPIGPVYQSHLAYGVIGLDRYKDFNFDWKQTGVAYPRVYIHPDEVERVRKSIDQNPLAAQLKQLYVFSGDVEKAKARTEALKKSLAWNAQYILSSPTLSHHPSFFDATVEADDVLAWKEMPAADRQEIRARLAMMAYLLNDPDVMGHGNGTHLGNPNMSVARKMHMANHVALLPDHPSYPKWRDHIAKYLEYKQAINTAPGGGWFEFGASYQMHATTRVTRALMAMNLMKPENLKQMQRYGSDDWRYYMNLVTPYDPRWFTRMIPGGANSAPGMLRDFYEPTGVFDDADRELASDLWTLWQNNGSPAKGPAGPVIAVMGRADLPRREPKLESQIYPGVGVIFRAHQGPDETYMFLRSGYLWSHWFVDDQNNFSLMSKGSVLVPYQPFQYYTPSTPELQGYSLYNTIRFGDPTNQNIMGWPDTNVLDHAFGPTVDYAWASSGYPEWFIEPGSLPGFGGPRKLVAGAAPQNGAFHWNRQVMFLKGATAKSPNYFVFRDTTTGEGKLPNSFNLDLLGRKSDVQQNGSNISVNTEFPAKLDLQFANKDLAKAELAEDNMPVLVAGGVYYQPWIDAAKDKPISPNWVRADGKPAAATPDALPDQEKHVLLRIPGAAGQEYFWVAYPRGPGENPPTSQQLAPGVMKIVTSEGTDYVFLSPTHFKFDGEDVSFEGSSGAVRVKGDSVTLVLAGGAGHVGYKGKVLSGSSPFERTIKLADLKAGTEGVDQSTSVAHRTTIANPQSVTAGVTKATAGGVTEYSINNATPVTWSEGEVKINARQGAIIVSPTSTRFVATDRSYFECSVGTIGARGVGPFDLTISNDKVIGTIDGDTRAVVVSKPKGIVRPMYHLDGMRWYAAFPDDTSPYASQPTPQYTLALGTTQGKHTVLVSEWTYPPLPPIAQRRSLR